MSHFENLHAFVYLNSYTKLGPTLFLELQGHFLGLTEPSSGKSLIAFWVKSFNFFCSTNEIPVPLSMQPIKMKYAEMLLVSRVRTYLEGGYLLLFWKSQHFQ